MVKLHTHHDIGASRDIMWGLLMDFGNIEAWWPKNGTVHIERVEIEGSGPGMVRYIHNAGFDNPVAERLDDLDLENYIITLSIIGDRPAGLLHYQARGQLTELEGGGCRLTYDSEFIAEQGREDEARGFLLGAYELMYQGFDQISAQQQ
jgi:hypothetical protein